LFVVASEEDSRDDKFRASITIYQLMNKRPTYPTILSNNRPDGTPIPWVALSALPADPYDWDTVYIPHDSYYNQSRLYKMKGWKSPACITKEIVLKDTGPTVNFDIEGVAVGPNGGF
jgi:hypothetical protein